MIPRNITPQTGLDRSFMIVDDAFDIRDVLKFYFSHQGYNVLEAQNGLDALEILRSSSQLPSLIILDLMMPIMDGFSFKREQDCDAKLSSIPVVVISADAHIERKCKEIGAQAFLKKPLDIDKIQEAVELYCSRKKEADT